MWKVNRVNISITREEYEQLKTNRVIYETFFKKKKSWGKYLTDGYGIATALADTPTRPDTLNSMMFETLTAWGKLYLTLTYHEGKPFELFCWIGHTNSCVLSELESVSRLASWLLRLGVPIALLINQLIGITCEHILIRSPEEGGHIRSIADAIAKTLRDNSETIEHPDFPHKHPYVTKDS